MRPHRLIRPALAAASAAALLVAGVQPASGQEKTADYTVLLEAGATSQAARAAIRTAGGRVTAE
ncbi:serine protease, partial [Actinosynnema sp. NPDC023658]